MTAVTAVVGVGLVLAWLVVTMFVGQRWWWEPEVAVPRDGVGHRVSVEGGGERYAIWSDSSLIDPVCTLADRDGAPVAVTAVPPGERVVLDEPWVAEPSTSATFTAPADGVVVATCDAVDATPVQVLHLAPMHPRIHYDAMQYGIPLLGLLLLLGGIVLGVVAAVRRPATRS